MPWKLGIQKHFKLINPTRSQTHVPVHPCARTGSMEQWEELPLSLQGSLQVYVTFIHSTQELIQFLTELRSIQKSRLSSIFQWWHHSAIDYNYLLIYLEQSYQNICHILGRNLLSLPLKNQCQIDNSTGNYFNINCVK